MIGRSGIEAVMGGWQGWEVGPGGDNA